MEENIVKNSQRDLYIDCIEKQLEEIQLLSSIYCGAGELEILDPTYVCEFEQFLKEPNSCPADILHSHLEFVVKIEIPNNSVKEKIDVRVELPHLYPSLENPIISIQSALLNKTKTQHLKNQIESYIETVDKQSPYLFQLLTWIQEQIEELIANSNNDLEPVNTSINLDEEIEFERLWIYSHHIKAKSKRQEIVKQSRDLNLSGFSRPGKPGIICVEGLREHTQEFWRIIKSLHWQKINLAKIETSRVTRGKFEKLRRFEGFKEQLFCNDEDNDKDVVMNMSLFMKYLEAHNSGYMKKELFGFE